MIRAVTLYLAAMFVASTAAAVECRDLSYQGNGYTVCEADPRQEELRLFLRSDDGKPYGHFSTLSSILAKEGLRLTFATNAGMYHADRSPVGLYLENGQQEMRLVTNAGPGNFGLLPNGVFCLHEKRAEVIETLSFRDQGSTRLASTG